MRLFHCGHCGSLVFFESFQCVNCGSTLAFVRDEVDMLALEPADDQPDLWRRKLPHPGTVTHDDVRLSSTEPTPTSDHVRYRMCANRLRYLTCNFALVDFPSANDHTLCAACAYTRVLPDLTSPDNLRRWAHIEQAKRRLYYTDIRLGIDQLPGIPGPAFEFLADVPGDAPILTGHAMGVITLNVAEADDDERARRRLAFHEPFRTLLGHLRHEIGHYFWDALIARPGRHDAFRALFGDERQDYAQALSTYYARAPYLSQEWQTDYVSAYATAHPWEDWAETWAHYLHLVDLLETAQSFNTQLSVPAPHGRHTYTMVDPFATPAPSFDQMMSALVPLTLLLNNLTRSLGQIDAYPFALSANAQRKMRFVHDVVAETRQALQSPPQAPQASLQAPA